MFLESGGIIKVISDEALVSYTELPVGTYMVQMDLSGYYLSKVDNMTLPERIYGSTLERAKRIFHTFMDRPASTGVHMNGQKGSGKTLLAKAVSIEGLSRGIPTIIVNSPYAGDDFNSFMQKIAQPAVILMDEFEKTYKHDQQEKVLTLLDGTMTGRKLFVITTNNEYLVSDFLINRPGRIFYRYNFAILEESIIVGVCKDNLKDQSQIDDILKFSKKFPILNFDMLNAVIEEMNRYNEKFGQVLGHLNIQIENQQEPYKVEAQLDDYPVVTITNRRNYELDEDFEVYVPIYDYAERVKNAMNKKALMEGKPVVHVKDLNLPIDAIGEEFIFELEDLIAIDGATSVFTKKIGDLTMKLFMTRLTNRRGMSHYL